MCKKIFVYGDSISLQWGYHFEKLLKKQYIYDRLGGGNSLDLADFRYNGGSSEKMKSWMDVQIRQNGTILLFNCGLHDIIRFSNGAYAVSEKSYEDNIMIIVKKGKNIFDNIIWLSITPVDDERHKRFNPDFDRYNEDVIKYNTIAQRIADKENIPVIDLYGFTEMIKNEYENIYKDHVHMVKDVSDRQAEFIYNKIIEITK